ncbi:hypothetical protein F5Y03DRAFT_63915 [Xylaria venustula]|nr:hypothetical protein F5Y03DRAFT_63915 [Xylaria venustula]
MTTLILPGQWDALAVSLIPERREKLNITSPFAKEGFDTIAIELFADSPQCLAVEDDLKLLIGACMAVDYTRSPRILGLHSIVQRMVQQRDQAFYQAQNDAPAPPSQPRAGPRFDVEKESDAHIRQLVQELIYSPPLPTPDQ